ncbi:MAG: DnaJ domain-containing protein [Alphaproteobacteria bacterium]
MPYILLVIGLLIGAYTLYRFFMRANVAQIKALFFAMVSVTLVIALFFMAITGRLPAALALLGALVSFALGYLRQRKGGEKPVASSEVLSRAEALEVLGLQDGASEDEIRAAYKKLMAKVHPDAEGSEWMAAKLNAARDILLK